MSASINNLKVDITHFFNVMVISVTHFVLFLMCGFWDCIKLSQYTVSKETSENKRNTIILESAINI